MLVTDFGGFTFTGEVVNGNGKGEAEPNLRLDNDVAKSFSGHLTRDVTPNLRIGVMGYRGRQTGAQDETAPKIRNTLWMVGGDATTTAASPLGAAARYPSSR